LVIQNLKPTIQKFKIRKHNSNLAIQNSNRKEQKYHGKIKTKEQK